MSVIRYKMFAVKVLVIDVQVKDCMQASRDMMAVELAVRSGHVTLIGMILSIGTAFYV